MNIKLHTPKSLKMGSGMSSLKQFLLSLFATTVSIALTFGTAAIIDYNKKQKEKREIVMMVMYDMYNSLESIANNDSTILRAMQTQLQIAEDTTRYDMFREIVYLSVPSVEYTETTEQIFSSSIETINTVGNVLFTENVAEFYKYRQQYKTEVCEAMFKDMQKCDLTLSVKNMLRFQYRTYAILSGGIKRTMQRLFAQCKQMMDVSDEELDAYLKERKQMEEEGMADEQHERILYIEKVNQLQNDIDSAKNRRYNK